MPGDNGPVQTTRTRAPFFNMALLREGEPTTLPQRGESTAETIAIAPKERERSTLEVAAERAVAAAKTILETSRTWEPLGTWAEPNHLMIQMHDQDAYGVDADETELIVNSPTSRIRVRKSKHSSKPRDGRLAQPNIESYKASEDPGVKPELVVEVEKTGYEPRITVLPHSHPKSRKVFGGSVLLAKVEAELERRASKRNLLLDIAAALKLQKLQEL